MDRRDDDSVGLDRAIHQPEGDHGLVAVLLRDGESSGLLHVEKGKC